MEKLSRIIPNKKKKLEKQRRREEEQLRIEVIKRGGLLFPSESLQDAMRTPRSPRELVISPRPLPEEMMKEAAPRKMKSKRASLNGEYIVGKVLGKGCSGTVCMAIVKSSKELVAVKRVPKEILTAEAEVRLRREYAIMKLLHHPNLIRLIDVLENPQEIVIIMEYASQGDLFEYIVTKENQRLTEEQAKPLFIQIALGVQYLHSQGFIHRDLKPENILLSDGGRAFIADLGFGTSWHPKKLSKTQCGSLLYASPEIVGNKEYVGPEVDVWSLGVLLYAMITGKHPFHGADEQVKESILSGTFKMLPNFSEELQDLLGGCMKVDRKERLTIDRIVNHPWLASVVDQWKTRVDEAMEDESDAGDSSGSESSSSDDEEEERGKEKESEKVAKTKKKRNGSKKFSINWGKSPSEALSPEEPTKLTTKKRKNSKS